MIKSRIASISSFAALLTLGSGLGYAAEALRLVGIVPSRMVIETQVGRGNSLKIRNRGNQAEPLEVRVIPARGRAPAVSRIWRVSAEQLAASYELPVPVLPGSRVVLSAP